MVFLEIQCKVFNKIFAVSTKVLNVLHRNAGAVAAFDLGFKPFSAFASAKKTAKLVYLLGVDEHQFKRSDFAKDVFIAYQGIYYQFFTKHTY